MDSVDSDPDLAEESFTDEDSTDDDYEDGDSDSEEETLAPTWSFGPSVTRRIQFTGEPRLLVPIPGNNTPLDWFSLLLDIDFLEQIISVTNDFAVNAMSDPESTDMSSTDWKELTIDEFITFIGLLLHTGTIGLNRLQDYWSTHYLLNIPGFRQFMTRSRFFWILRYLSFSKISEGEETKRENQIKVLIKYFNSRMRQIYYPGKDLVVDEGIVLRRGKLVCPQSGKGSRYKLGIKIHSINEPDGLFLRYVVNTGKSYLCYEGRSDQIILKLADDFLNKGHSLFVDETYNSFTLASRLLHLNTYCTGPLKSDRKHIPPQVKTANLNKGEQVTNHSDGVTVSKWKDDRSLLLYITTEFQNDMVQVENNRNQVKSVLKPTAEYNIRMKSVDRIEQMMAHYPCERQALSSPKKVV
ncbi:piggyBac transposable element-derived protein 4-like [Macrosteles quadrilineatus]|uniref:piggyBac transposable element-derived protein 4-like n=1 Tax=Macrosteles quadrilineatus TaxID=74068 RepID=UPI0023E15F03|nr:piggyBac transposable element-derived protein 4-like [Macrosteles quadrilineatus]